MHSASIQAAPSQSARRFIRPRDPRRRSRNPAASVEPAAERRHELRREDRERERERARRRHVQEAEHRDVRPLADPDSGDRERQQHRRRHDREGPEPIRELDVDPERGCRDPHHRDADQLIGDAEQHGRGHQAGPCEVARRRADEEGGAIRERPRPRPALRHEAENRLDAAPDRREVDRVEPARGRRRGRRRTCRAASPASRSATARHRSRRA